MATLQDILGGGLPEGLLTAEQQAAAEGRARNAGLLNLAFGLLQASQGQPGMPRPSLGQVIGQAGPVGVQAYQSSFDKTLQDTLRSMQIAEMRRKQQTAEQLRQLAPSLITTQRAPSTQEIIPSEQGDDVLTRPGAVTGYGINLQALPALAALGPEGIATATSLAQFQKSLTPERVTLKPGERVVEPTTGKVLAEVPATPEKIDLGTHVAFIDPANPTKVIGALPKGKDPKELTSTELSIGSAFNTQAAPFITIGQAYKKIETAANNPSAAGDISLIFGYMKLLDPASVVREGEFATAQNAGSIPQSIYGMYNKALNGERLAPSIRSDFLNQAKNLISSQKEIFDLTIKPRFESLVQSSGVNRANVMFDPFASIDLTKTETPSIKQTQSAVPTIRQTMENRGGISIRRID